MIIIVCQPDGCKKVENLICHPKEDAVQKSLAEKLLTLSEALDNIPTYYVNLTPFRTCPHCYIR